MYLETIDEKAFRSFLSNPAISVLDGNVLDKYNGSNFYRFVRVPLSDGGEHHVDAIFGNMYSTYDLALNAHRFSANGNLEFMAYLVDTRTPTTKATNSGHCSEAVSAPRTVLFIQFATG